MRNLRFGVFLAASVTAIGLLFAIIGLLIGLPPLVLLSID